MRENWQQNILDNIIENCAEMVERPNENFTLDRFGMKCSTKMAQFSYCIWRQLTIKCPIDRQQRSRQCRKLRNVLNKMDN